VTSALDPGAPGDSRWLRVEGLFRQALELPPEERPAFLASSCDDEGLRDEVTALLEEHEALQAPNDSSSTFLDALDARRASALLRESGPEPVAGETFVGRYRVERRLGRGGMGVVYLARDPSLGRPVALKVLSPHLGADAAARRRLVEEARAASALDHPHLATVYEIGETDDERLFIAMAYYEGETLREKLGGGSLSVEAAARIAAQVADGLAAAHRSGIVHRDIKPENLICTRGSGVKVVDFGVAKVSGAVLTKAGGRVGTVGYMSPEQTRGEAVDGRADVWALGVVLYEMLTGQRPFRGDADGAVIHSIRHDDPEPVAGIRPDVPPALAAVVQRSLEKDPARRFGSASEMRDALLASKSSR
jgi:eukaryotic-like serine/threonine-protein kinase